MTNTESDLLETLEETARHLKVVLGNPSAADRAFALKALAQAQKKIRTIWDAELESGRLDQEEMPSWMEER